jgi:molybdopterin molybdotransferase
LRVNSDKLPYILGVCAANSGSGKTYFIERILPFLKKKGLIVSVIKHAHHRFDIDTPGKDSFRIREAGSFQTLVFNDYRAALITEVSDEPFDLDQAINQIDITTNIILIEGIKSMDYPKIEIYRKDISKEKLFMTDDNIIAVASDCKINTQTVHLDLNNLEQISNFIIQSYQNEK